MTTIAYKDGVLAGDGRVSEGEQILTDRCRKVFRLPDGSLFGARGDAEAGNILCKFLRETGDYTSLPPELKDFALTAVLIRPDGGIFTTEGRVWEPWLCEPYVAIGSGGVFARVALRLGHDVITAVKCGIASDPYSGGKITKVTLRKTK